MNVKTEPMSPPPIKTHLALSVVSAVCLFPPTGIAAIVFSVRTAAFLLREEGERAQAASKTAFALFIVSAAVALIGLVYAIAVNL